MTQYVIHIPNFHPVPLNKIIHSHWTEAMRLKRSDCLMISTAAYQAKIPKAQGKRLVGMLITLGKGQRACDPDAYWKSTLDALVKSGYLKDDNRQWLELKPIEFNRNDLMATTITIEDVS